MSVGTGRLRDNEIHCGDARSLLKRIRPESVALSFWSPPYFVGKSYEKYLSFEDWQSLLREVIRLHFPILKPGGFLAVNIADILAFPDPDMPRIQADNVSNKRVKISRERVLEAQRAHPHFNRYQLAELLGCSEQTIDRRLNGNNVRGGKYAVQRKVKLVGGLVEEWADEAGFYWLAGRNAPSRGEAFRVKNKPAATKRHGDMARSEYPTAPRSGFCVE